MKFLLTPLIFSTSLQAAIIWDASTGSYTGGTQDGDTVVQTVIPGTSSGYTDLRVDAATPHSFRTYAGSDLGLTHSLSITDALNNPVLVQNLRLNSNGSVIIFSLASDLAAGTTLNLNFSFDRAIGTFETPNNVNPFTGSNAEFATRIVANTLGRNSTDFNDVSYRFTNSGSPLALPGETAGPWDYSTDINPNGAAATGRVISGAFNEIADFTYIGKPNGDQIRAAIRDNEDPTNASNFTDAYTWSINAGANVIPAGTTFNLTLDGTPIPEPTSNALILIGGISVLLKRRRK